MPVNCLTRIGHLDPVCGLGAELPPVSIAVGIIADGGIVFASDSQSTRGNAKDLDAHNIGSIQTSDDYAFVAVSGNCEVAERAIELLQEEAKDKKAENRRSIPEWAQKAMRRLRNEIR